MWTQTSMLLPEQKKRLIWLMPDKKTEQRGYYYKNLWFNHDGVYVYYTPYSWKYE